MKDYSLNYDDSKKFILSYKIENGKIVKWRIMHSSIFRGK